MTPKHHTRREMAQQINSRFTQFVTPQDDLIWKAAWEESLVVISALVLYHHDSVFVGMMDDTAFAVFMASAEWTTFLQPLSFIQFIFFSFQVVETGCFLVGFEPQDLELGIDLLSAWLIIG